VNYAEIRKINVNDHIEKKNGLSYLSWAWAWDIFKQHYPDATYKVIKSDVGIPYFETAAGVMVYTEVTADGITHEMWLPVMDGANNAMKAVDYQYDTKYGTKLVKAFDMFDVNKTIMRCLVKNLAMFGLGIYIYAGEDLPDDNKVHAPTQSITPTAGALENFSAAEKELIHQFAEDITELVQSGDVATACSNMETLENEEKVAIWALLDSKTRSTIKSFKGAK
jgi:hypothetical protein